MYLHAFSFVFPLRKKGLQYSIQHYEKASKLLIACKPIYQRVRREEVCKPQGSSIFPAFFGVNYYYYSVQLQSTFCLEKSRALRATEQEFPSSRLSKGIRWTKPIFQEGKKGRWTSYFHAQWLWLFSPNMEASSSYTKASGFIWIEQNIFIVLTMQIRMAGEELCSATKITLRLSPGSTFPFLKPRLTFFLLYSKVWAPFRYLRYIAPWWTYSTPLDDTSIFYLGLLASKETQLFERKKKPDSLGNWSAFLAMLGK